MAQLMKRRGGVGFDISKLRPKGMVVRNAAKTTDGIGCFMERFSNTTREVAQNGRRGALMLTVDIRHPEIETFINIKRDLKKVTGANISIRISDEFMNAVEEDREFELYWPVDAKTEEDKKFVRVVKAKDVWEQIIDSAHAMAEPGLLFWDTIIKNSPADSYASVGYESTSVNPCSEIVLSNYDSCRLMLLNTSSYVHSSYSDKSGKDVMFFDFFSFCQDAMKAQKLMDDLVDLEVEKIDKILEKIDNDSQPDNIKKIEKDLWCKVKKTCVNGRRTGLGVTGIGDTIAKLGHVYGDERSIKVVDEIYRMLCLGSYAGSIMLAKERGSFPVYDSDKDLDCIFTKIVLQELEEYDGIFPTEIWGNVDLSEVYEKYGRRNIANLTTAPCGSVSLLTQTTSGIEPAFRLSYTRRRRVYGDEPYDFVDDLGDKWEHYTVYHKGIEEWKELNPEKDIEESVYYHSTSDKIDWISRVKLQGAAQKWIDHAISSTCNLPNDVTKETVSEIYMKAWKEGCKGFTIYRDGCRTGVLVTNNSKKEEKPKFTIHEAPNRTEVLSCDIHRARVKKQDYTILIGLYEGKPYEVFAGMSENIEIPDKYKKGKIEKIARKTMPIRS
jgi:ribonucleoside-diphosphate reductase alpha chain